MVCALHRLFQKADDDRIMEGDFDPEEERRRRDKEERRPPPKPAGWLARLRRLLPRHP